MQEEVKKIIPDGYKIIRPLDSVSAQNVYLAKRNDSFFVLKWPEPGYKEEETLKIWSFDLAPEIETIPGEGFALEYLQGRQPLFWNEEDYQKLFQMFLKMKNITAPSHFTPLEHHLYKLEEEYPGLSFPNIKSGKQLVHGDLHPLNIFIHKKAKMIDPYGFKGDIGFDIAFLAATLANNQEDFLHRMSKDVGLPSAKDWFLPLVFYRLENSRKYKDIKAERVLRSLAQRVL